VIGGPLSLSKDSSLAFSQHMWLSELANKVKQNADVVRNPKLTRWCSCIISFYTAREKP